jgi:hypothetical protein
MAIERIGCVPVESRAPRLSFKHRQVGVFYTLVEFVGISRL